MVSTPQSRIVVIADPAEAAPCSGARARPSDGSCHPGEGRIADAPASPGDPGWTSPGRARRAGEGPLARAGSRALEQRPLWANDRYALLVVLQAMDAARTRHQHVMGVNPQGVQVVSFRPVVEEPTTTSWRIQGSPERGRIGIFNRSRWSR
jgi:hypothetical protein